MPIPKKKTWEKPTVTRFAGADDLRAHFAGSSTPEELAALDRMIDRARRAEDGSDVDQEDLRRRHYG